MNLVPSTPLEQTAVPEHRIFSIDVIRGIALLGILFISVWEFGGFTRNQQLYYQTGPHGGNYKLWTSISILLEGKMRGLFAIAFGAGILLFTRKKDHPVPISEGDAYIRRMLWLIAFGLINAFILLWPGDMLFQYGVVGILLYGFTRLKAKGFFIAAIICTLIYCGKLYWDYADDRKDFKKYKAVTLVEKKYKSDSTARALKDSVDRKGDTILLKDSLLKNKLNDSLARKNDTLTKKQAGEKGKWEGMMKSLKYDSAGDKGAKKLMWSGWPKIAYQLMSRTQQKESTWLYRIGVWEIGAMMLLGMGLFSLGFFNNRFPASRYLIIAILCIVVGIALGWFRIHYSALRTVGYETYIHKHPIPYNFFFPIEKLVMALGYVAAAMWLLRLKFLNGLFKIFSLVGRMAFTNYFLQTIACTLFFYGYGFGYFGRLKQWELYFFVMEMIIVQIAFSVLWLKYYKLGPVEWLWRCLIYKKWLPNRNFFEPRSHEGTKEQPPPNPLKGLS